MQDITLDVGERYMLQLNEEISECLNDGYVIELHNCSLIDTAMRRTTAVSENVERILLNV